LEGLGIESSLGVVAHTDLAVQEVQELGLECRKADLPYAWERTSERRIGPRAQRDRRKKLVIFGHIDSNRRVDSVIQALASMNERDQFRLDIFGLVYPRNLEVLARVSGNHRNVKFHGYVSDARLDEALATADLGINLRHPTMGESSISQLRFWAHGVPTVCTREGWYAELDETLTEFVRTEHEIDDLRRVFRRLLDDPEYFRAMGRRGRERLATKHNPARYADMIWSYARDILASNGVVR
jgi:glycosyltransferase involved in cell wall biosynthesis